MPSVASGKSVRRVARTVWSVLGAGSGTLARYSPTAATSETDDSAMCGTPVYVAPTDRAETQVVTNSGMVSRLGDAMPLPALSENRKTRGRFLRFEHEFM